MRSQLMTISKYDVSHNELQQQQIVISLYVANTPFKLVLTIIYLPGLVFVVTSLCFVGLVVQQCRYRRRGQRVNTDPDENEALLN